MRNILLTLATLLALSTSAFAETVKATVHGMVCAFCATGIEKKFKTNPEVDTVKIDLARKLVTIKTKPGRTISDAKVTEVIKYAGYSLEEIVREKK
jgi:mercuric ion binding protein